MLLRVWFAVDVVRSDKKNIALVTPQVKGGDGWEGSRGAGRTEDYWAGMWIRNEFRRLGMCI